MRRRPSKSRDALAGALALAIIGVGVFWGFTKFNPLRGGYEFSAAFRTASDVKAKSPVRVAGVTVGQVTKVEGAGDGARVHMRIDDEEVIVRRDAQIKIRPRIFLEGNWFVDLSPGSPSAPALAEGKTIPVQQTAAPVQFGEVLEALQSDTREDLRVVLDEYGSALSGGGAQAFNRTIGHWKGAWRDSAIVNQAMLGELEHDLSGYIKGADRFARGLDRDPEQLKALITDLGTTATAFASEERNLSAAIGELPRTLAQGRAALGELNDAFPPLRRFVADLRPAVRTSGPALDAALPLVRQLRGLVSAAELKGLVRDLGPTVSNVTKLNEEGVALQKELRLLSSCALNVLTPWRSDTIVDDRFPASGPVFQEQVKWLPGIAAESRNFDANGQYVRSLANGATYAYPAPGGRYFITGQPLQGVNPPKVTVQPPFRGDVACETQQPPDLRSNPAAPPSAVKVNLALPAVQEASEKAKGRALRWLGRELTDRKLPLSLRVEDLAASEIARLKAAMP
jgi:virulence factor Mce-like protein